MGSSKLPLLSLVAVVTLLCALTLNAQERPVPGVQKKYPASKGIDLRKPIGPGNLKNGLAGQGVGASFIDGVSRPSVHVDVMTSYSKYYGYTFRETYTYSRKGDLTNMLIEIWDGEYWFNYDNTAYTYDAKGNLLTEIVAYWDGVNWVDYLRFTYTYDKKGLCTYLLYEDIYGGFTERITMFYDNQQNRIKELGQYWDGADWVNLELWTYTYNNQRDMVVMYGQQDYGGGWTDYLRETWTYLAKGKWLTDRLEYPNTEGVLENYLLYTNQYDKNGNRKSFTGSGWYGEDGWIVEFGGRFTYDKYNNMVSSVHSTRVYGQGDPYWADDDSIANAFNYTKMEITGLAYVKDGGAWVRGETEIYIPFYDVGNILVFADEYPSNKVVVKYSRNVPGYGTGDEPLATDPPADASGGLSMTVSPNPVQESFRITINAPESGNYTIDLLDIHGSLIRTVFSGPLQRGVNEIGVPGVGTEGKGMFFLKASSPEHSITTRLIRR